jgi:hypothetical protein
MSRKPIKTGIKVFSFAGMLGCNTNVSTLGGLVQSANVMFYLTGYLSKNSSCLSSLVQSANVMFYLTGYLSKNSSFLSSLEPFPVGFIDYPYMYAVHIRISRIQARTLGLIASQNTSPANWTALQARAADPQHPSLLTPHHQSDSRSSAI